MSLLDRCLTIPLQPPREPAARRVPRNLCDRLTDEDQAAIVDVYRSGSATMRMLGAHYGISDFSVRKILRLAGVGPEHSAVPSEVRHAIVQRRRDGMSLAQIAREMGVPEATVRLIAAEA